MPLPKRCNFYISHTVTIYGSNWRIISKHNSEKGRRANKDKRAKKRLYAIELRASGKSAAELAKATGFHPAYITQLSAKYHKGGIEAIAGTTMTGYVKAVGHRIEGNQICCVLKRHNWRNVMPRSKHPQKQTAIYQDEMRREAQEQTDAARDATESGRRAAASHDANRQEQHFSPAWYTAATAARRCSTARPTTATPGRTFSLEPSTTSTRRNAPRTLCGHRCWNR